MINKTIAIIRGDGIGPEIMDATLRVLDALSINLNYEFVNAGLSALETEGELLPQKTIDAITQHQVALKSPLTTPIGKGFTSINVQLRRLFDLYANVRPVHSFPNTASCYQDIDMIVVRENTEGAYRSEGQTRAADDSEARSEILITRKASERIARYAYEMAVAQERRKVTIVHKANIIKSASGLFLDVAREVASEFPKIQTDEMIVDNCCMQLVKNPKQFDIILTTNLFGDIISDLCAGLVGGLGLAPGANIGRKEAIFEAVHGSAPDIAGQNIANPCALMLAAIQMLEHMKLYAPAQRWRSAILATLQAGKILTADLGGNASTQVFTDEIINQLKINEPIYQ